LWTLDIELPRFQNSKTDDGDKNKKDETDVDFEEPAKDKFQLVPSRHFTKYNSLLGIRDAFMEILNKKMQKENAMNLLDYKTILTCFEEDILKFQWLGVHENGFKYSDILNGSLFEEKNEVKRTGRDAKKQREREKEKKNIEEFKIEKVRFFSECWELIFIENVNDFCFQKPELVGNQLMSFRFYPETSTVTLCGSSNEGFDEKQDFEGIDPDNGVFTPMESVCFETRKSKMLSNIHSTGASNFMNQVGLPENRQIPFLSSETENVTISSISPFFEGDDPEGDLENNEGGHVENEVQPQRGFWDFKLTSSFCNERILSLNPNLIIDGFGDVTHLRIPIDRLKEISSRATLYKKEFSEVEDSKEFLFLKESEKQNFSKKEKLIHYAQSEIMDNLKKIYHSSNRGWTPLSGLNKVLTDCSYELLKTMIDKRFFSKLEDFGQVYATITRESKNGIFNPLNFFVLESIRKLEKMNQHGPQSPTPPNHTNNHQNQKNQREKERIKPSIVTLSGSKVDNYCYKNDIGYCQWCKNLCLVDITNHFCGNNSNTVICKKCLVKNPVFFKNMSSCHFCYRLSDINQFDLLKTFSSTKDCFIFNPKSRIGELISNLNFKAGSNKKVNEDNYNNTNISSYSKGSDFALFLHCKDDKGQNMPPVLICFDCLRSVL